MSDQEYMEDIWQYYLREEVVTFGDVAPWWKSFVCEVMTTPLWKEATR